MLYFILIQLNIPFRFSNMLFFLLFYMLALYWTNVWRFKCTIRRLGKDESTRNGGQTIGGKGVMNNLSYAILFY